MTKILILNDLHSGVSRESSTIPGLVRQANNEALGFLQKYVSMFNQAKYDLVINLGDAIRDVGDLEQDSLLLESVMTVYAQIVGTKIFIPGNHELSALPEKKMREIMLKHQISNEHRGTLMIDTTLFIWLDTVLDKTGIAHISEETLIWLEKTISDSSNVVLFSHYSIPALDGSGSFHFAKEPHNMSYTNGDKVLDLLHKCASVITINAHTHMGTYKKTRDLQSISALAFSENIVAMQYPEANPGIYSVLLIEEDKRIFKSYSGEFCFLSIEL